MTDNNFDNQLAATTSSSE